MFVKHSALLKVLLSILAFIFTGLDIGVIWFVISTIQSLKDFPSGWIIFAQWLVYIVAGGIFLFSTAILVMIIVFLVHIKKWSKDNEQGKTQKNIRCTGSD